MRTLIRTTLMIVAVLTLAACKGEEKAAVVAPVILSAPTSNDDREWRAYLVQVVKQNMQGIRSSPFMYYLPEESAEDFDDQYERQLENVIGTVSRGVVPGNMLAFGSPSPKRMAELIEEAFVEAEPGSMKDVRVLYIGSQDDAEQIRSLVEATGAGFVQVDP